jgi:hypothetical protein
MRLAVPDRSALWGQRSSRTQRVGSGEWMRLPSDQFALPGRMWRPGAGVRNWWNLQRSIVCSTSVRVPPSLGTMSSYGTLGSPTRRTRSTPQSPQDGRLCTVGATNGLSHVPMMSGPYPAMGLPRRSGPTDAYLDRVQADPTGWRALLAATSGAPARIAAELDTASAKFLCDATGVTRPGSGLQLLLASSMGAERAACLNRLDNPELDRARVRDLLLGVFHVHTGHAHRPRPTGTRPSLRSGQAVLDD